MKNVILLFTALVLTGLAFGQKVKTKDGIVTIDDVAWSKYETLEMGSKMYVSTMAGEEYVSLVKLSFGTGRYQNGQEVMERYMEINFYKTGIGIFEYGNNGFDAVIKLLYTANVLVGDVFNEENALAFKEKYAEDITGRYFKTKNN